MGKVWAHVFDLGNVLVFVHEERFYAKLAAACRPELPVEELFNEAYDRADLGRGGNLDQVYTELVARAGLTLTREAFGQAWDDIFSPNPPMLELLPTVPHPRVLLSNTSHTHVAWIRAQWPELFPRFDHLVLSNEVGFLKPQPEIYRCVEALTGLPPEQHIFTDDLEPNLAGARACGWHALRFTDADTYQRELALITNGRVEP